MLDSELLRQLEANWLAAGATTLEKMAPGLTDEDIDRIAAPLGFRLPEEVRRLYRWHDGSNLYPFICPRALTSLEQTVEQTLDFVEDDDAWKPGWVHVMDEKPYVVLACSGEDQGLVPVWHYDYAAFDFPSRPVFASIGDMVAFWIDLIDQGSMFWRGESWWIDEATMPDDALQRLRGVPTD